jgi:hypothetical protein
MRRRSFLALLLLPAPAAAEPRRPRTGPSRRVSPPPSAPQPTIDPPQRAGMAPMPDRRFPTAEQAERPGLRVIPAVPTGANPTRGTSYGERDSSPERASRGSALRPEPGLSVRIPLR